MNDADYLMDLVAKLCKENTRLKESIDRKNQSFANLRMRKTKAHRAARDRCKELIDAILCNARVGRDNELAGWARAVLREDAK